MRPGQRLVTALMLVVCAAVGVAIAGVPHRSSEPAIHLTNSAAGTAADPFTSTSLVDTTTSTDPTTTAPTTTTTAKAATTTTTKAKKAAAAKAPSSSTTTAVPSTVVRPSATTLVRPTGLNPEGR